MQTLTHASLTAAGLPSAGILTEPQARPFLLAPTAPFSSVVTALFPYGGDSARGNLSLYARGPDYHEVVRRRLTAAAEALELSGRVLVDVSPFDEVRLAAASGLGGVGQNGLLLNRRHGSFFFLGTILTDRPLASLLAGEVPACTGCGACVTACPTGALSPDGGVDASRCLSALTQSRRLTPEQTALLREALRQEDALVWGCDACQLACPANAGRLAALPEFRHNRQTSLALADIAPLSDRAFRRRYQGRAFTWRGVAPLKRNLGWAAGGDGASESASEDLAP